MMVKEHRKLSLTTNYVIIVGLLLLVANTVLGVVLLNQSKAAMRTMIRKNMLDITNTAADFLDGDRMATLTEEDVRTEPYREVEETLLVFQKNAEIQYIYTLREDGPDHYVFTVDPDPLDPAHFGEEVVITQALIDAADGVPSVDTVAMEDRWGRYYSAFSPFFDSAGRVAGVVGVDFSSEWYDAQLKQYTLTISLFSILSVVMGGLVMVLITRKIRRRFWELDDELSTLAGNVDELTVEITSNTGYRESVGEVPASEEEAQARLQSVEAAVERFNTAPGHPEAVLSLSQGMAAYRPGEDEGFQEVFFRADEAMYAAKGEHHRRMPALMMD